MIYWIAAAVLLVANGACVVANMIMLPGNWLMVGTLSVFLLTVGVTTGGPDWSTLMIVLGLAIFGEILETLSGSANAINKGASRRAMILSLIVSMFGSIAGAMLVPVPVIGSAVGAIAGAAVGAFGGAWMGEAWKGTEIAQRTQIGKAAMHGRMLGMLAKLAVGVAIFVLQLVSLW